MPKKIGNGRGNDVTDMKAYNKTTTDFNRTSLKVKPLDKIQQTKPQESRARKLENGIALKMARIVSKFKTTTIVYSILQKSAAKIGYSTHIYEHMSRITYRIISATIKKIPFKRERFIPAFLTTKNIYLQNKTSIQHFGKGKKTAF